MSWLTNWFNTSRSSIYNEQDNDNFITQNYSGTCKISCDNEIHDANINIINSNVQGGVSVTQECNVDGQCYFGVTQDATSNIVSKATNSSNARNVETGIGNTDVSNVDNRQYNRAVINQAISQHCDDSSINDIQDMNLYVGNSNIQGGVSIMQKGNVKGNCSMNANMKALADATSIADNKSSSGKDKKASKKGSKFAMITTIVGFIVLLLIVFIIAKLIAHHKSTPKTMVTTAPSYNPPTIITSDDVGMDT